jgi:hypothetical protein
MCPHPQNMDNMMINIYRVHQPVFDIDPAGIKTFEVADKSLITGCAGKRIEH